MKYPEKALMPRDSKGNLPSDEAWERVQRIIARESIKREQQLAAKEREGA